MKITLFLILFLSLTGMVILAQDNPFFSKKNGESPSEEKADTPSNSFFYSIQQAITEWQKGLNQSISSFLKEIKTSGNLGTWLTIFGLSFLYGFIHAIAPGHRKTIISSYFLAQDSKFMYGLLLAVLFTFLHAGSGVGIVLILYIVIKSQIMMAFENVNQIVQIISSILLAVFGFVVMIVKSIEAIKVMGQKNKNEVSVLSPENQFSKGKKILPLVLVAGIIPCPGAAMIMMFSISLDIIPAGIYAVIAMSLGMGATLSLVALLTIASKQKVLKLFKGKKSLQEWLHISVDFFGALLLLFFGIVLLIGALG
jgi:nickel/cobalt exporter